MTRTIIVAAGAIAIFACGCSSFNSEWKAAAQMPVAAGDIAGRWEGTWKSEATGHNGNLRCIISPASKTNHYQAYFHAKYAKILSFSYTVDLDTHKQGEVFEFTGSADLGKVG